MPRRLLSNHPLTEHYNRLIELAEHTRQSHSHWGHNAPQRRCDDTDAANPNSTSANEASTQVETESHGGFANRDLASIRSELNEHSHAVTLARTLRELPAPWVVTDEAGWVQYASPMACRLIAMPAPDPATLVPQSPEGTPIQLIRHLADRIEPPRVNADDVETDNAGDAASSGPIQDHPAKSDDSTDEESVAKESSEVRQVLDDLMGPARHLTRTATLRPPNPSAIDRCEIDADAAVASVTGEPRVIQFTRTRLSGRRRKGRELDREMIAWVIRDISASVSAAESRSTMLLSAAHELRTPLHNLSAAAETMIAHENLSRDEQREFCSMIVSQSGRLVSLVDSLLAVDQIDAGSLTLHRNETDLVRIADEAIEQCRSAAAAKDVTIELTCSPKLPLVRADRRKLQLAVNNVVANAVKYTPAGGEVGVEVFGSISGRCHTAPRSGSRGKPAPTSNDNVSATHPDGAVNCIVIRVTDSGVGIPADECERVFEKFYRASNAESVEGPGNGLGLPLARRIMQLHGGDIELESQPGSGSTFSLRLPIR